MLSADLSDGLHRSNSGSRMTPVKCANTNSDDKVERLFPRCQREFLDSGLPERQSPALDQVQGCRPREGDGFLRSVDPKHETVPNPVSHRPCKRAWTAADFEHAHVRLQRQPIEDIRQPWR